MLHNRPFQPFRVHLKDGRVIDVPYTGMCLLNVNYIKIGVPITEGPYPICSDDEEHYVQLKLIERIEEIGTPTTASAS